MSKYTWLFVYALVALVAAGIALALQPVEPPEVPIDPRKWFTDTGILAGVVVVVVQFIKPHLPIKGVLVKGFAVLLGVVLAILGYFTSLADFPTFVAAVSFGGAAGILAAGGKDVLKSILGNKSGSTPPKGGTIPG